MYCATKCAKKQMRVIFRWSVKNACAWIGYAPPVIATYSKSTRENDHQPAEYDLVASYFQRKPRSGHYAIYGKQPLSGCQTISLEGAEPATGLFVLKHIQWYQFKSAIPNVWNAIFGLYFQYIAFRYLRIIIINCNHYCYGYFSTLEDRRKNTAIASHGGRHHALPLGHLNTPRLLFGRKDADGAVVFWVMGNDGYTGKKNIL